MSAEKSRRVSFQLTAGVAGLDFHPSLSEVQLEKLGRVLAAVGAPDSRTWDDFRRLPFTTKAELAADQQNHLPYGTRFRLPPEAYSRLHQTSGTTTGQPLRWFDTPQSWSWILDCWHAGFRDCVGITPCDRIYFPFSFGPFLGFWAAFEAAARAGNLALSGGGLPTTARLRAILEHRASVLCCTPTYALHLAEVAEKESIDLKSSALRAVVVAGEPGGTIPATRERIGAAWNARVFDHYGLTEVGPVAFETAGRPNEMKLLESEFIVEVLDPATGEPAETGELVVTNLGRLGSPLIRYRTGDLVALSPDRDADGSRYLRGGILGRADDMIQIRGNNLYPTALEGVIRRFAAVAEYRIVVDQTGALADLRIEIEPVPGADGPSAAATVARALRDELLFRADVTAVPPDSLPRYELKSRRVVRIKKSVS